MRIKTIFYDFWLHIDALATRVESKQRSLIYCENNRFNSI